MTLVIPKTKVSPAALTAVWNSFAAHKSLSLASTCVPHAMGYEDDGEGENGQRDFSFARYLLHGLAPPLTQILPPVAELCFHFEHIPAKSLSRLLSDSRFDMPTFKMDEFSPLYRHWAREILISLSQLQEQVRFSMQGEIKYSSHPRNLILTLHSFKTRFDFIVITVPLRPPQRF